MTQALAEILLLVPTAFAAGFVMFVAGRFLHELVAHAVKSAYAIVESSVTFIGMIPYWYVWGFSNSWFTAGLFFGRGSTATMNLIIRRLWSRLIGAQKNGVRRVREGLPHDKRWRRVRDVGCGDREVYLDCHMHRLTCTDCGVKNEKLAFCRTTPNTRSGLPCRLAGCVVP